MKKILATLLAAAVLTSTMAVSALAASFEMETIIQPQYEMVDDFSDDLAAVKQNGKWGYIDEDGKMVIRPQFDWAGHFSEGVAVVGQRGTEVYDAGTDYEISSPYYDLYLLREDGTTTQLTFDLWGDAQPQRYYPDDNDIASEGAYWFCQNGVVNANGTPYDTSGREITVKGTLDDPYVDFYTMTGPCVGGVIPMYAEGPAADAIQAFFMDKNGNITRKFPPFSESGITRAYAPEQDRIVAFKGAYDEDWNWSGGWGALDMNGNWVVQPVYENFRYMMSGRFFCDGLWTVTDANGRYGAVDKNGKVVIPLQYEFLSSFNEGMCAAKQNGSFHYIDLAGNRYEIGALSGGVASGVSASSFLNGGVSPVYISSNGQAYCVQNVPVNRVLPAIAGTETLGHEVYFPDYVEGSDDLGTITSLGEIAAIRENGKYGFARLTFTLDLPDQSAMDSWAYDEVCKAIEAGLVPNELQNQYRSNITRGDFALLLTEVATTITEKDLETLVKDTTGRALSDIVKTFPFTDATGDEIIAANALGIINGYGNGKFGPYDTISRQDAATMLLRAATAIKADAMEGWGDKIAAANIAFADGTAFAAYAREAISVMAALDVMKGTGENRFSPSATYTRQQSFMTVYRLMTQILA